MPLLTWLNSGKSQKKPMRHPLHRTNPAIGALHLRPKEGQGILCSHTQSPKAEGICGVAVSANFRNQRATVTLRMQQFFSFSGMVAVEPYSPRVGKAMDLCPGLFLDLPTRDRKSVV